MLGRCWRWLFFLCPPTDLKGFLSSLWNMILYVALSNFDLLSTCLHCFSRLTTCMWFENARDSESFFFNTMVKNYNQNCQLLKKKIRMHIFDVFLTLSSPHICQKLLFCVCYVGHQEIVQNWLQICFCGQALSRGNYWSIENLQFSLRKLEKKVLPGTCWFLPPITDFLAL